MKERAIIYQEKEYSSINAIKDISWATSMDELVLRYKTDFPPIVKQKFGNIKILSYREASLPPSVVSYRHARILASLIKKMIRDESVVLPLTIADIGTGSGIVPIVIARDLNNEEHTQVTMIATDISGKTLEVAALNMEINNVTGVQLRKRGALDGIVAEFGKIDVLISNPPYSQTSKIGQEIKFVPRIALDGGADGLDLHRRLLKETNSSLSDQGIMTLQCQQTQLYQLLGLVSKYIGRRAITLIPHKNGGPITVTIGNPIVVSYLETGIKI